MGKIEFDPQQQLIIDAFRENDFLQKNFYFTGGTALSVYYFAHRESEDLDFFTAQKKLPKSKIQEFMTLTAQKHNFTFTLREMEEFKNILIYSIDFEEKETLKLDFNSYPYPQVEEKKIIDGISVDSLRDIGTNKLQTVTQRTEVKDFVDLFFLLREFTLWDLIYGVEAKFKMKIDQMLLGMDFMKVEEFETLPKMLVPLELEELQTFFISKAKELAEEFTT